MTLMCECRERGGTVVISDRGDQTTSSLIISHVTAGDSGQYQCDPSASYPQHVNVHVIDTGNIYFEGASRSANVGSDAPRH